MVRNLLVCAFLLSTALASLAEKHKKNDYCYAGRVSLELSQLSVDNPTCAYWESVVHNGVDHVHSERMSVPLDISVFPPSHTDCVAFRNAWVGQEYSKSIPRPEYVGGRGMSVWVSGGDGLESEESGISRAMIRGCIESKRGSFEIAYVDYEPNQVGPMVGAIVDEIFALGPPSPSEGKDPATVTLETSYGLILSMPRGSSIYRWITYDQGREVYIESFDSGPTSKIIAFQPSYLVCSDVAAHWKSDKTMWGSITSAPPSVPEGVVSSWFEDTRGGALLGCVESKLWAYTLRIPNYSEAAFGPMVKAFVQAVIDHDPPKAK